MNENETNNPINDGRITGWGNNERVAAHVQRPTNSPKGLVESEPLAAHGVRGDANQGQGIVADSGTASPPDMIDLITDLATSLRNRADLLNEPLKSAYRFISIEVDRLKDGPASHKCFASTVQDASHRCVCCGHRWNASTTVGELCGDCWLVAQPVLQRAAPAVQDALTTQFNALLLLVVEYTEAKRDFDEHRLEESTAWQTRFIRLITAEGKLKHYADQQAEAFAKSKVEAALRRKAGEQP